MQFVFHEPSEYNFKNRDGHSGKFYGTQSDRSGHLIIEVKDKLGVVLTQKKSEFCYYVIEGSGYFIINDAKQQVAVNDLIVIPPSNKYTFGGTMKMLLVSTPKWSADQEIKENL